MTSLEPSNVAATEALKKQLLQPSRPAKTRWRLGALVLLAGLIGGALWWQNQTPQSHETQYQTALAEVGNLTITVTATGTLQPLDQVDMSSETSGTVKQVMVEENDPVKTGQTLLKLDTTTLEAQVKQAQANVHVATAQLKQAQISVDESKASYERKRSLLPLNYVSKEELSLAEASYLRNQATLDANRAQLQQAQATLALQQDQLRKATIVSPFDGVVLSRQIDPGQTVAASLQAPVLFTLARDLTQMELLLYIDEADVGHVAPGQKASFTVDAYPNALFSAIITKVHLASETVEGVVTYQARLKVNNPDGRLRPGMTSTADIIVNKVENTLLVPNRALRFVPPTTTPSASKSVVSQLLPRRPSSPRTATSNTPGSQVWVLQNNQPTPIEVQTGLSDGLHTQILSGLQPGQAVIVDLIREK